MANKEIHYGCLGLPGCSHVAGAPCDCKCHAKDAIYEGFVKRFLCDIPDHVVMSDHQFKHEIQGQLPKHIIQFAADMYQAGLKKAEDLVEQDIGMLRQWLNEDRITYGNKMVTNEQLATWVLSRLKQEQEKL